MIKEHVGSRLLGHVSRDSTAIKAREKSCRKNIADLPHGCDWGKKQDSKGKTMQWKAYKLHIDTVDGDIPVSALLTSASTAKQLFNLLC